MTSLALDAMLFARHVHRNQVRKYTGNPYVDHLAEVAGIVATVAMGRIDVLVNEMIAVAWLHDCVEDQGVTVEEIEERFGPKVALGVSDLSDLEEGSRAYRKAASRERLAGCAGWIQTIKCADLISNTSSIVLHDPKFAFTYLVEKRLLVDVMTNADARLLNIARAQASVFASMPEGQVEQGEVSQMSTAEADAEMEKAFSEMDSDEYVAHEKLISWLAARPKNSPQVSFEEMDGFVKAARLESVRRRLGGRTAQILQFPGLMSTSKE